MLFLLYEEEAPTVEGTTPAPIIEKTGLQDLSFHILPHIQRDLFTSPVAFDGMFIFS